MFKDKKDLLITILTVLVLIFASLFLITLKQKNTALINYNHAKNSADKLAIQKEDLEKEKDAKQDELNYLKSHSEDKKEEQEQKYHKEIEKIEKSRKACLDTGTAMLSCNYKAMDKYDTLIKNRIEKYKEIFTQSQYTDLVSSQEQWTKFIEADNKMLNNSLGSLDGTIHPLMASSYKVENYITRASEIIDLYELYVLETKDLDE